MASDVRVSSSFELPALSSVQPETATTSPPGLDLVITYGGSAIPPSGAGVYEVVATVDDPDYQGSASATLTAPRK